MKVRRLIELLEEADEDAEVYIVESGHLTYASCVDDARTADDDEIVKAYYGKDRRGFFMITEGDQIGMYGNEEDW